MICIIPLILTNLLGNQILIPSGQEKRYSQSVFVGMWINLILNIVLIPFMGAFGAALGTLVTECWNVFWMGGGAAKDYRKMLLSNVKGEIYLISLLFSIMASVGMNFLVQNFGCPLFGQLVFVGITFFGVYYLLLLLQKEPLLVQQGRNVLNKLRKKTL
jgi:O-antigen/teichoic acid export membrane protein